MCRCHVSDAVGKTVAQAVSVTSVLVDKRIRLLGRYPPAMSATSPALLAPPPGRRPPLAPRRLREAVTALLWALLALRVWPSHPAALPAYLALGLACVALAAVALDSRL